MVIRKGHRPGDYAGVHPGWCTCKLCRPRHPNDGRFHPVAIAVGLGLLVIAIIATI